MEIKESKNFLTKESKLNINNLMVNPNFPYYVSSSHQENLEYPYLSHVILKRPEERNHQDFNSPYANLFLKFLKEFQEKNKIKVNKLLRIAVNLTFNFGKKKCYIHKDHEFDHKQLIIYLNDCDKNSKTIILDDNKKIIKEVVPEKFKGVMFGRSFHTMIYPKTGYRVIAIYTFT
jgi:hypothetical protein